MTDVESKTPTKRKFSDKGDKKGSAKKGKFTPKLQNKPANKQTPKQQNKASPKLNNVQNNNQKAKNKKGNVGENGSPKKLKPFVGTSEVSESKEQGKKNQTPKVQSEKGVKKHPRKNFFITLRDKLQSEDKQSTLQDVINKIKDIESRNEISKSAKKKLRLLNKLKNIAEGNVGKVRQQTVTNSNKSPSKSRRDRRNKAAEGVKSKEVKTNETNLNTKLQNKQLGKKNKVAVKDEDDFEISEEESDDEEESGADQEVEEEDDGEEDSDEAGGEEEESDEDEDQAEGSEDESEEQSDEEESEEESPPQVSNKKQKKK